VLDLSTKSYQSPPGIGTSASLARTSVVTALTVTYRGARSVALVVLLSSANLFLSVSSTTEVRCLCGEVCVCRLFS
jgi:hypothetical protein